MLRPCPFGVLLATALYFGAGTSAVAAEKAGGRFRPPFTDAIVSSATAGFTSILEGTPEQIGYQHG